MKIKAFASMLLKVILPVAVGLVLLVVVIAWLSGFFSAKIEPGRTGEIARPAVPAGASIDVVHEVTQPHVAEAIGTLKAASRTEVSAQVSGRILDILVKSGDRVEVGDVLVRLDPSELQAALGEAEAAVAAAEAAYVQAQQDYRRDQELVGQKVIAQARFEASTRAVKTAEAQLAQAQQAVERTKVRLSYTVIGAPQAGTVVDTLAEPGEITAPGVPLVTIYDLSSLRLEVSIMENLASKIRRGQELAVQIDALGNRQFEAVVDEIVPQAQAASRSFLVKLRLPQVEGAYEGMFGLVKIPVEQRRFLCLNRDAVQTIGQLDYVDVVREDNTLERRLIKLGRVGGSGRVEVISGLEPNQRVLLRSVAGQTTTH